MSRMAAALLDTKSAEALDRAARAIEERGWIKHRMASHEGFCLAGALAWAGDQCGLSMSDWLTATQHLAEACEEQYGQHIITKANDCHLESKEAAVALLEKAAVNVRSA